jgi:hypothetical protein
MRMDPASRTAGSLWVWMSRYTGSVETPSGAAGAGHAWSRKLGWTQNHRARDQLIERSVDEMQPSDDLMAVGIVATRLVKVGPQRVGWHPP